MNYGLIFGAIQKVCLGDKMYKIEIDDRTLKDFPFNLERKLRAMLKIIPSDYLKGICAIRIVYSSKDKNVEGRYIIDQHPCIVLYSEAIFGGYSKLFLKCFPFFVNAFLADVLFHELGHHYHMITHGHKKKIWEQTAERYSKEMKLKFFYSKGLGKVIFKIKRLLRGKEKNHGTG